MGDHGRVMLMVTLLVVLLMGQVNGYLVDLTILDSAVSRGAVCLDGSAPGYYFQPGHGDGANNWLIHLSGGGWCTNVKECTAKDNNGTGPIHWSITSHGQFDFSGMLNPSNKTNPYFYNWNRIFVAYCDGASFLADVEEPLVVNATTTLYFRGRRIYNAMMEEFLAKGMKNANNAILMGTSAGGMSAMLHCDEFRAMLPNTPRVKCVSESGLFFRSPGLRWNREETFNNMTNLHGLVNVLPNSCTSRMEPHMCIFAENYIGDIKTPLFLIQSQFDLVQLGVMADFRKWLPGTNYQWTACLTGKEPCPPEWRNLILEYQKEFLEALPKSDGSFTRGLYIDSCLQHDHSYWDSLWIGSNALGKTLSDAVRDWYFDISPFQEIDKNDHPVICPLYNYRQK